MGELLRRYWMPIAAVAELDDTPTKPVRLMGEDLVLYKDQARHTTAWSTATARTGAPTSRTAGSRTCGLRCNYHGWLFDADGPVPASSRSRRPRTRRRASRTACAIKAYPVEAKAGLLWAYLGPHAGAAGAHLGAVHLEQRLRADRLLRGPLQLVPVPGELDRPGALRVAAPQLVARRCKQATTGRAADAPARSASTSSSTASSTGASWRASPRTTSCGRSGATCLWPNCLFTGGHFEWRVPIDDEQHAQRGLVLRPRAQRDGALRAGAHPVLVRPDQRPARPAAGSPRT